MKKAMPVLLVALFGAFLFSGCNMEGTAALTQEIQRLDTKITELEIKITDLETKIGEMQAAPVEAVEESVAAKPATGTKPATETKPATTTPGSGSRKGARVQ